MIDSNFRGYFQNSFDRLGLVCIKCNMSPNFITFLAFLSGLACCFYIISGKYLIALILLWISGLMDVLDGTVARLCKKSSSVGMYMDLILDRMVECAVIFGFAVALPEFYIQYILFLIFALFNFTTFLVAASVFKSKGLKGMHYDAGIVERTEAFIAFSLMMVLPAYAGLILFVFNLLMLLTGLIRFFRVIKYLSEMEKSEQNIQIS